MKQLKQLLLVMAIALTGFTPAQAQTPWTHYSEWMAYARRNMVYTKKTPPYSDQDKYDGTHEVDWWRYDDGLMYESILDTYEYYKTREGVHGSELLSGVQRYLNKSITGSSSSPSITNFAGGELDDMRPGRLVWKYCYTYDHSEDSKIDVYKAACAKVINANAFQDDFRVGYSDGHKDFPWQHKDNYTQQVWLDGIFMGIPYWTLAGPQIGSSQKSDWGTNATKFFDDAVRQMQVTDSTTFVPTTGLWCHAWDYTKTKTWADCSNLSLNYPHITAETTSGNNTGRSLHTWGRALGWYAMAIMETMDNITAVDANYAKLKDMKDLFKKVMDAVISYRDETSGVWYCVLDVGDNTAADSPYNQKNYPEEKKPKRNNYLEATCSSMFAYCLLHGVAKGYLDNSYLETAKDAYKKVVNKFITTSGDEIHLNNCMQVGGLDSSRDGSFAYYMSEPVIQDDSKGVGPFIWASLEAEKIGYNMETKSFDPVGENTIVSFAWSKASDEITQGSTYSSPTFTARSYGNDTPLTNSSEIDFVSSNPAVATVAADGTITPVGIGTATITAALKTVSTYTWSGTNPTYTITVNAPDVTAPTLSSSTPVSGTTNIATSGNIVLTFSEAVTVADASKFTLSGGTGSLTTGSITGDGTTTITIPYTGLANETSYTFATAAGAVQDASGNPNAALSNILFTTAVATSSATFDFTGGSTEGLTISKSGTTANVSYLVTNETYNQIPTLSEGNYFLGVNFTNNSAGVLDVITTDSYTNITSISFDCAADNNSNPKVAIYIIDSDNKETEIQNAMVLSSGSTKIWRSNKSGVDVYTLDLSSSPKTGKVHFKFTTGSADKSGAIDNIVITTASSSSDTTAPTFTTSPANSATNVAVDAAVTLTADENIFAVGGTINGTLNGTACTFNLTERVLTLPHDAFANNTTYTVVLNANQIQDAAGNKNAETSFSFTTVAAEQEQVATPSISGNTSFTESTTATITCATTGATIHYTLDGSTPTASSTTYSSPIAISATTTIKAIAIKDGMTDSKVATQTFTKSEGGGGTSATITYNLNVGTTASTKIKNSTSTTDATNITNIDIDQAHDGANGTGASNRTTKLAIKTGNNGETFDDNPTNYELFKFTIATGKQFTPSEIAIKVANVGSSSANDIKYKAVLSDESGHSIDGTYIVETQDGTVENFVFANSSNTAFIGNVTLKLWAWQIANSNASAFRMGTPLTITGTIEDSGEPIIPTYTVTATSNNNSWGTVSVDKATAAEGATVTITTSPASGYELTSLTATDGESNPVTITNNQFTMPASNVTVNATFAAMEKVATPSISGNTSFTESTTATITCTTTGATIHYTTDSSTPTASSTTYSSPIAISATTTVKAIAVKEGMTDSEVASATFTKSGGGGGGSGTVLFSQNFDDATEVAYAANTEQAITATSGNNIVGKDVPSTKFTSITCNAKNDTGIGINSTTGGNSKDYTGKFGAFYDNTSGYWSIVKTTSFASTTPTAIKVEMNAAFSPVSSGSNIGVQFAVGSEFTDELTNTCPALSNCVAGFALPSNNNIRVAKYSTSNANTAINSSSATITKGDSNKYTWIINNTDETLTYKGADGNNTTVAAGCWDLWIGTSRNLAGISKSTTGMSGTSLENIYIGSPFGKKHEFILDDIVVTDLSPAAMRTTTATIKAGKQYATFNTTMDIDFDETDGLQAFVVDNATKSSVHLTEVTVVPANTALIIKGAPNTYTLYETKKATESVSDNQLIISNSTVAADNKYYALGTVNGVQGFHRVQNGLTIPTSYVIITDQTAKSFLNFEEEENIATGIDGFTTDNGFIVIDDNTPLYNLSGQRVSKSYKGIVIINGKKVLRK